MTYRLGEITLPTDGTPYPVTEERIEVLIRLLREMLTDVRRSDRHAQVVSGATALLVASLAITPRDLTLTAVLLDPTPLSVTIMLLNIVMITLVVATTFANLMTLRPRHIPSSGGVVCNFGTIAAWTVEHYAREYAALTPEQHASMILQLIRLNGMVVAYKRKWVRLSAQIFLAAVVV
ncbi:MAG: DUF5706 domain-containing protein [Chloroflexota bacterium]|nr:DUF5706 domain-containing protein [Chloroflexota bacterium]